MFGHKHGDSFGPVQWRGIDLLSGKELFRSEVYQGANNLGELMAIYDGVHWMIQNNHNGPIFSDSVTAIAWAMKRKIKSSMPVADPYLPLWNLVWSDLGWSEAEQVREVIGTRLCKWDTKEWGENPSDFNRK